MKAEQFNYILENIIDVEITGNENVMTEFIINGMVESLEYYPVVAEGLTFEIQDYVLTFDYNESNDNFNALTSLEFEGDHVLLTVNQYLVLEAKIFNNIKFI